MKRTRQPSRTCDAVFLMRIPASLHKKLLATAHSAGFSAALFARLAIQEALEKPTPRTLATLPLKKPHARA